MKILFVENKLKTKLYYEVSRRLKIRGREFYWLVQNPIFAPRSKNALQLGFPSGADLCYDDAFSDLKGKDRYVNTYRNTPSHYHYYYSKIFNILSDVKPDIVFGECTLFHELLAIEACKALNILYLTPATCRYPPRRFSFYRYDSLEPWNGSGEMFDDSQTQALINSVLTRSVKPDYMSPGTRTTSATIKKTKNTVLNLISSSIVGEKYNTPQIQEKLRQNRRQRARHERYESVSSSSIRIDRHKSILFPLQLQPESNIDVWGYPYNDQVSLIKTMRNNLGTHWSIYIKPNPKSKYEITDELINTVDNGNIVALSHNVSMNDLFNKFDYFFSVTGTINIEAILARKFCYSPALPIVRRFNGQCFGIPTEEAMQNLRPIDASVGQDLVKYLVETSYPGVIGDEVNSAEALTQQNLDRLAQAFGKILSKFANQVAA